MVYTSINLSIRVVRLLVGVFFIILGIAGIFPNVEESIFSLNFAYSWLEVLFGLLELVAGVLLVVSFFTFSNPKPAYWGGLTALVLWCITIILTKFAWGFNFIYGGILSIPLFITWLLELCVELIIAVILLVCMSRVE